MSAETDVFLQDLNASKTGEDWVEAMESYVDCLPGSTIEYLSLDDTSFLVERGSTLLVVIEAAEKSIGRQPDAFPTGWLTAASNGWSYLGLLTLQFAGATSKIVLNHIAQLVDKNALAGYEKIVFAGTQDACELVLACADLVDNSTAVLIQPKVKEADQSLQLSGELASGDLAGGADQQETSSKRVMVVYDPMLLNGFGEVLDNVDADIVHLPCRHMGQKTESFMRAFDLLPVIFEMATLDDLGRKPFFSQLRQQKRSHRAYWRNLLRKLDNVNKPGLSRMLCENVVAELGGQVFKRELQRLNAL